jgi:hypothetical protein
LSHLLHYLHDIRAATLMILFFIVNIIETYAFFFPLMRLDIRHADVCRSIAITRQRWEDYFAMPSSSLPSILREGCLFHTLRMFSPLLRQSSPAAISFLFAFIAE